MRKDGSGWQVQALR